MFSQTDMCMVLYSGTYVLTTCVYGVIRWNTCSHEVCLRCYTVEYSVNTKHLYNICTMLDQGRRNWADVVQMLYKYFVFVGYMLS